jgi:hypothetical protein
MSINKVEYFKPGRSLLLVAVLLLVSMGLQFYTLPQVLKPNINGEVVEGTVVGVVLIFSYTLTTLGFLFLLMEYFNLKNKVKVYAKLTDQLLPSETLEKSIAAKETAPLTIELPKEKPAKKSLFSGFGKSAKKEKTEAGKESKPKSKGSLFGFLKKEPREKVVKDPKPKGKGGLFGFLGKKEKEGKTTAPKPEKKSGFNLFKKGGEEKEKKEDKAPKEQKPGLFSRFARKKEKSETVVEEPVIKKISIEAVSLPAEKPTPLIEPIKAPVIELPKIEADKPAVVLIQKTPEPTSPILDMASKKESKPSTSVADLLGGVSLIAKPKDEATAIFEKLKPMGAIVEEKKPEAAPDSAPNMAADLLKAAADAHAGDDESKYKTVGVKVAAPEQAKKPVVELPPITLPQEPTPPPVTIEDSEFLKVLTELRSVVDDMKVKKKGNEH